MKLFISLLISMSVSMHIVVSYIYSNHSLGGSVVANRY